MTRLLDICEPAIERGERVHADLPIRNVHRVVGTIGWLNDRLGLPGIRFATAQKFTDKYLMREALRSADVEMPHYAHVDSLAAALAAAESIGYPVVLKPKLSWASKGVHKVDDAAQLQQFFPRTRAESKDGFLLVEEDAGAWGGRRARTWFVGRPGWKADRVP